MMMQTKTAKMVSSILDYFLYYVDFYCYVETK